MGRVFTRSQLEQGRVPTAEDFENAIGAFSENIELGIRSGLIDGGAIFGSAAIKATSVRSDIDCMIVPVDQSDESLAKVKSIVDKAADASRHTIPINAQAHSKVRLVNGRHEMDRFFGAHLIGGYRTVFGTDPAEYIHFPPDPADKVLFDYIRHKKRSINGLFQASGSDEWYKGAQRILELPNAIGRKALCVVDEIEATTRSERNVAHKGMMRDAAMNLFKELGADETAQKLFDTEHDYNDLLNDVLSRDIDSHEYEIILQQNIDAVSARASRWLDTLDDVFMDRFKQA